ncbi:MAG: alanine racemase [Candidatus Cyclobacteriaceae bacterium M2_1C_046]
MDIIHPTLLLDKKRCIENIKNMSAKARANNLAFKPHFKTHQSLEVGEWFRDAGVEGITVSSIKMAEYFADAGWQDITIAFPANIKAIAQLDKLAQKIDLTLLVDNTDTAKALSEGLTNEINVLVELDAGSKRTGISVFDDKAVKSVINYLRAADKLAWKGFYSHFGHTYGCRGENEIKRVFSSSLGKINELIKRRELQGLDLHIGDTPGCSVATGFPGVTAITPGNFVFYDVMQQQIGACEYENIAVALACPVVSKRADRDEIIVHGGAVHFSKDHINTEKGNSFGVMTSLKENGIGDAYPENQVVALSQEHGLIKIENKALINDIKIGDIVGVLPIHSCLTAECMGGYQDFSGNPVDHL